MDGFDDLLTPSRDIFENNPFADPFAKRSNSPDPWASPFASSESYGTTSAFQEATRAQTPPLEDTPSLEEKPVETSIDDDPLESSRVAEETEEEPPLGRAASPKSPGFRESVAVVPPFSETATIRPAELEDARSPSPHTIRVTSPVIHSPKPLSAETAVGATPLPDHAKNSSQSTLGAISRMDSPPISYSGVVSPLEQPTPIGLGKSIAALALTDDAIGGWQPEQSSWATEQPVQFQKPVEEDEDSEDDKPIGQILKGPEQESKLKANLSSKKEGGLQPVFVITVDDPQKVGDPIRSFTMYTVHTRTTSPIYPKSSFSVLRRYSDFLWLYETLSNNNPGVVVPPVPEKNPFGRFDDQFVKQRRFALEKCIQKIANHPVLGTDLDLKMFLESDTFALDIKHRKAELAHERGGIMASLGQTIAGPRFYETDEWFERQRGYLDSLESQLRGLVKAIDVVTKQRADVAIAVGEFHQILTDLSTSDIGSQLAASIAGLAEVERKVQDLANQQSEQDMVTLMATVDEYARLISSVRLAFSSRVRTYHSWKNAEAELLRVKQSHEKNRAQGRIPTERLGHSLAHIAETERRALESKHEFESVSKLVKSEVARFEQERIEDFKDSLNAFLEGMITRQKELIGVWENYQHALLAKVGGGRGLPDSPSDGVVSAVGA